MSLDINKLVPWPGISRYGPQRSHPASMLLVFKLLWLFEGLRVMVAPEGFLLLRYGVDEYAKATPASTT